MNRSPFLVGITGGIGSGKSLIAKAFFHLAIENNKILTENAQISILNGSMQDGKASELSKKLRRLGMHVIETGNYESETAILEHRIQDISSKTPESLKFLKEHLGIKIETKSDSEITDEIIDLEIILGVDNF